MNLFRIIYTVLIITLSLNASAQTEYFITNNNDTVTCRFTGLSIRPYLRYKITDDSKTQKVNVDTVKEYKSGHVIYGKVRLSPELKYVFLERVLQGRLNLYLERRSSGGYVDIITWYAAIENDSVLAEIKTSSYFGSHAKRKAAFKALIADAPKVAEMFAAEDSYESSQILKAIENYNLYYSKADVYFVNKKNDTTRCKIINAKDSLYLYKTTTTDFKALNTDSLNAYKLNNVLYYRRQLPEISTPQFISQTMKGDINVYTDFQDNWYVSKLGGELVKIKGKGSSGQFKKAFTQLISDKPDALKELRNKIYNADVLTEIITVYNQKKL